jgi:hypothetical protein
MTSDTTQRPPEGGRAPRGRRSRALLIGLVTAALLSAVLALTISSRHEAGTTAAQTTTPTPASTPWTTPAVPALPYPRAVWLDPTGKPLPALPSGTVTTPCSRNSFAVKVSPEAPVYARGVPVVFRVSVVFNGPNPCDIHGIPTPSVTVLDNAHHVVWQDTGRYAVARMSIPEGQLTAAGDVLVHEFAWVQDACAFANCPETEVPTGSYSVQAYFQPYGQSDQAGVQIGFGQ